MISINNSGESLGFASAQEIAQEDVSPGQEKLNYLFEDQKYDNSFFEGNQEARSILDSVESSSAMLTSLVPDDNQEGDAGSLPLRMKDRLSQLQKSIAGTESKVKSIEDFLSTQDFEELESEDAPSKKAEMEDLLKNEKEKAEHDRLVMSSYINKDALEKFTSKSRVEFEDIQKDLSYENVSSLSLLSGGVLEINKLIRSAEKISEVQDPEEFISRLIFIFNLMQKILGGEDEVHASIRLEASTDPLGALRKYKKIAEKSFKLAKGNVEVRRSELKLLNEGSKEVEPLKVKIFNDYSRDLGEPARWDNVLDQSSNYIKMLPPAEEIDLGEVQQLRLPPGKTLELDSPATPNSVS